MDELPPRPLVSRATQDPRRTVPQAEQKNSNPIGGMIGCLAAGAWSLIFASWFHLSGAFFWIALSLGFVLIALGFILVGVSVSYVLDRARR